MQWYHRDYQDLTRGSRTAWTIIKTTAAPKSIVEFSVKDSRPQRLLLPRVLTQQGRTRNRGDIYSIFHVIWATFSFNRIHLGIVSPYITWLWLITLLMCTLIWLYSIDIQCHERFHLKPKADINCTEISSLICKTILTFNEHNFQYNSLYAKCTNIKSWICTYLNIVL